MRRVVIIEAIVCALFTQVKRTTEDIVSLACIIKSERRRCTNIYTSSNRVFSYQSKEKRAQAMLMNYPEKREREVESPAFRCIIVTSYYQMRNLFISHASVPRITE